MTLTTTLPRSLTGTTSCAPCLPPEPETAGSLDCLCPVHSLQSAFTHGISFDLPSIWAGGQRRKPTPRSWGYKLRKGSVGSRGRSWLCSCSVAPDPLLSGEVLIFIDTEEAELAPPPGSFLGLKEAEAMQYSMVVGTVVFGHNGHRIDLLPDPRELHTFVWDLILLFPTFQSYFLPIFQSYIGIPRERETVFLKYLSASSLFLH